MKTMTRRLGLQILAGAAAAPAAATSVANPDAELIELGRQFVAISLIRDAAEDEARRSIARRSYPSGISYEEARLGGDEARKAYDAAIADADEQSGLAAAQEAFDDAMDELRALYVRMISMRPTTMEGLKAVASAVFHFQWDGKVENIEGSIEGAALAVLVAGLLDKPLPDDLPDWAAAWI
ncbi:hypothetical protein [Bradyrhizobium australafricanum]|uniref:hypothetical protein n=1 Tax=Bradyrhizobium australafricanum TaxID=2821406 RepID=UPI001CE31FC8|nr:hypothetical protein [Bradyrhizobium australafricanum]MCA6105353.1 hypothetical protein [Bradyrhizobium australafricanum]